MAKNLGRILDALALVRLRRSLAADLSSELADLLLVDAADDDLVLGRNVDGDAVDLIDNNRMGVAKVHDELLALLLCTVADTIDLKLLRVTLLDADDHVVQQRAGQAMQALVLVLLIRAGDGQNSALLLDDHIMMEFAGQCTLRALDGDEVALSDGHFDAGRYSDRHFTDSGHKMLPPYQTNARTSPPTCAALSVMTPLEVEMMAMPRPLRTFGSSAAPA